MSQIESTIMCGRKSSISTKNENKGDTPNYAAEMQLQSPPLRRPTKSDWYSVWQGHRKFDLFAERNEGIHGSQRRLVSRIYSMDSLKDLEIYVDDAVSHFMAKMREMQGQNVNMGLWVQLFAFGTLRGT